MLYRGISDESYELISSLGRKTGENTGGDVSTLERSLMTEFRRLTVPLLVNPPRTDFEWLFLAQHYGLPTRLLDWSTNPLVALYFAAAEGDTTDGAFIHVQTAVTDQYELFDPSTAQFTVEHRAKPMGLFALQPHQGTVIFVRPRYSDARYLNQKSVFACPADPFTPLRIPGISTITIPAKWKPEIRKRLRVLGISTSHIYPGLAGAASEIKSLMFNPVASGQARMITLKVDLRLDFA
ncbi:hypothetical protein HY57_13155 [Dyella japonica A8]|uniref:FRG domain-containing protein n=2 Tax=Dyella japonica TaxID=231455 RepID=A0A075K1R9_9GAMM|nr:hypothetical protein HY57_13155 [Dyella japonica A8]